MVTFMDYGQFRKMARYQTMANKNYFKVFGIGFNKTGTTTLETIFHLYGLSIPNQRDQEAIICHQLWHGNYTPLKEFVSQYDAFQDQPFSRDSSYIICDALFPNSKFILTIRDSNEWFQSLSKFHEKIFKFQDINKVTEEELREKADYLYENYFYETTKRFLTIVEDDELSVRWDLLYNKDFYIAKYERRNADIIDYFKHRPTDLLVIDLTNEANTSKIVEFLNLPANFVIDMPHMNKISSN